MYIKFSRTILLIVPIFLFFYLRMPFQSATATNDATVTTTLRPSATLHPSRTSRSVKTETPTPTSVSQPTETNQPTKTSQPTKTDQLTETNQPTETNKPTKTAGPTKTAEATKSIRPTKTTHEKTATPRNTTTPTSKATATPTGPHAWLDASVDLQDFSPVDAFKLHFYPSIDITSIGEETALLLFPWAEGECIWSNNNSTLTFQPAAPLTPEQIYHIYINPNLTDTNGEMLSGTTEWTFMTGNAPRVISRSFGEEQDTQRQPEISLTFDHPMDTESVETALSVLPTIPFSLTWQDKISLTLTTEQLLTPGQQLVFTVAGSATDTDGIPMGKDYTWNYTVKPFTVQIEPFDDKDQSPKIQFTFSYPMDTENVEAAISFTPPITGTFTWKGKDKLYFAANEWAEVWSLHDVIFTDVLLDDQGKVLPTPETLQYVPPAPIRLDKAYLNDGSIPTIELEDSTSPLEIVFRMPVDTDGIEEAFQIEPEIEGTFSWNMRTLIFQPEYALPPGSEYVVTISPEARTQDGHPFLVQPYEIHFRSQQSWRAPAFGEWGANIQVVDASGTRAIQFQGSEGASYDFSLYRLDLPTFLEKYQTYFTVKYWNVEFPVIPTGDGELTASWEWSPEQMNERAIIPEVYLPADAEPGLYLLNMKDTEGNLLGQLFVVLTDNTLMVKWAGDELLIWVSDINGESVPHIEVRLYSDKGEEVRTGKTDSNGIYRTTIPEGYHPMLVAACTAENDFTFSGIDGIWGDYSYSWWQGSGTHPMSQPYQAYPYTDRPIYRPGQTVYFKAIMRAEQDVKYSLLPEDTPVTVRVRDTRDNIVQTFDLVTNEFSSVNGKFQLADGAMPGTYAIEVIIDDESFRQDFKVQDYRKPEIQASITTDAEKYVAGDAYTITVQADYFFDEPVANAKVTVRQYRLGKTYCWWGIECPPEDEWTWYQDNSGTLYTGKTDANGQVIIPETAKYEGRDYYWYEDYDEDSWYSNLSSRTWGLEVTVEDGSGQAVSNYTVIKVYNLSEKLELDIGRNLKPTGKPFSATASIHDIEGEPVSGRELTLTLRQWNKKTYSYDSDIITPTQMTTDENGQMQFTITPPQNGYFKLRLSGEDSHGNELLYNRYIYAYAPGDTWATHYSRSELSISADQTEVKASDTVQLLIESTFAGPAMLTFERGSINRVKPITLTPPLTIIDTEIIPEDAPNIFVTVNVWQPVERYPPEGEEADYWYWDASLADSALRRASVELSVDANDKALDVSIASDQEIYMPRATATFTMTVTNAQEQPVEAELSLALVDEAIYTLSKELALPIFEHFYGKRTQNVYTYNSMAPYRILHGPERGGGGSDEGAVGINPRADFPDTAIWIPSIITDKSGVVTVSVDLPDNLTTWRVVVRATTKNTHVGEAIYNITTQQPVVIRPQLPRTLTVSDTVTLSAFVHNYTNETLDLFTSIQISDPCLEITGTKLIPLSLAAGEDKLVAWQADVLAAGEPQVTITAFQIPLLNDNNQITWSLGDAVQLPLEIQPLAVPEVAVETGTFTGEYNTIVPIPPDALSLSTVKIELSRSVASSLLEGLEYLTGYPYGCVEQTMSRALPNAVVGRAFEKLDTGDIAREEALEPLINASVQRLYGYQHSDGGWGWWYDDISHNYQTAWVVFGLAMTAEAGYEVDSRVIANGVTWLQEHLDTMDIRTRAYALYSITVAGGKDPTISSEQVLSSIETLDAQSLNELDPFSQAALALAYHELGAEEPARAILQVLENSATQKDSFAYWQQPFYDGYYERKTMASTTRSTALVLDAFVQIDPQNKLIPDTVTWLMKQRNPYGWGTTNETAYSLLALTDHLQTVQENLGETELQIRINDSSFLTATVAGQQPILNVEIPFEQFQIGINHLNIKQISGEGDMYFRFIQHVFLAEAEIPAAGDISIQRKYLHPSTKKAINNTNVGELVLIELTVDIPQDGFYMIIEDHLPGGLEAVNEGLNNTSHELFFSADDYSYREIFFWEDYGYNNKEIHADRVNFFITEINKGKHTYTYLARATRPGEFSALPSEIYAMYEESLWGRSASNKLIVLTK